MELEIVILSEFRQTGEISYSIPYMWNLKRNHTNELIYKTERLTDLENKLMVARGILGGRNI